MKWECDMINVIFVLLVTFNGTVADGETTALGVFQTPQACTWVAGAMNSHQGNDNRAHFECIEQVLTDV